MANDVTLILQRRPHRAGGQVALWRLFSESAFRTNNPVLVTEREGWLTKECARLGVPVIIQRFTSPRSLWGRIGGNWIFRRGVIEQVESAALRVHTVLGNDHYEAPMAAALARDFGATCAVILRSADATEERLRRYQCGKADLLLPVGREFYSSVRDWFDDTAVREIGEGLLDSDFHEPKAQSKAFPSNILVIGSGHPLKGWQDMIAACDLLSNQPPFSNIRLDFTGDRPSGPEFDKLLAQSRPYTLNFIGRSDNFIGLVRKYDLVVQPTQCESFGLAGFEVLSGGVPMLTTRVGDVVKVLKDSKWLCSPYSPADLASKLAIIAKTWGEPPFPIEEIQNRIRKDFHIGPVSQRLSKHLNEACKQKGRG